MKLLYCIECADIVPLRKYARECECGKASGAYDSDGLHAWISGPAVPIGFENRGWCLARVNRPKSGQGSRFPAFVIPKECDTVRVLDEAPVSADPEV